MRTIGLIFIFTFITLVAFAPRANAQQPAPEPSTPNHVSLFAGYSYFNTDLSSIGRASTYGWEGSGEVKVFRWVSMVGDIDTHYGHEGFPICQTFPNSGVVCSVFTANFIERNFLVGPRVSYRIGNLRPFAEVLAGYSHVNAGDFAGTDNSFGAAVGGGVDYKLSRRFEWRVQGDYVRTQFFSARQDNGRVSTGLVVHF
jgi:hypothetical protein